MKDAQSASLGSHADGDSAVRARSFAGKSKSRPAPAADAGRSSGRGRCRGVATALSPLRRRRRRLRRTRSVVGAAAHVGRLGLSEDHVVDGIGECVELNGDGLLAESPVGQDSRRAVWAAGRNRRSDGESSKGRRKGAGARAD